MDSALLGTFLKAGSGALSDFGRGLDAERRRKLLEEEKKRKEEQARADAAAKRQADDEQWLGRFKMQQEAADNRAARTNRQNTDKAMTKAYIDVETDRIKSKNADKLRRRKEAMDQNRADARFDRYLQGKYQPATEQEKRYFEGKMQKAGPKTEKSGQPTLSELFKSWIETKGQLPGIDSQLNFNDYARKATEWFNTVAGGKGKEGQPTGGAPFDPNMGGMLGGPMQTGNAGIDALNQIRFQSGAILNSRGGQVPAMPTANPNPNAVEIGPMIDPENYLSPEDEIVYELLDRANAGELLDPEEQQFLDDYLARSH